MSHQIIDNTREAYIKFYDNIEVEDIIDYSIIELFDSNKPITLTFDNLIYPYNFTDGLVGIIMLANEYPNVKIKGLKENFQKSLDNLLNL